jgi:NADH-quinone oxidoreductase subunit L
MYSYYLTIVLAPLAAAIIAGLAGKKIGRAGAHWVTIIGVGISCVLSFLVLKNMFWGGAAPENISVYTWAVTDGLHMEDDVRRHICVAGGACLHNRLHA